MSEVVTERRERPAPLPRLEARAIELDERQRQRLIDRARRDGAVLERDGLGVYAIGEIARIELPRGLSDWRLAREALGSIQRIDGALPIALGALPFLPDEPASLLLAPLTLLRRPGGDAVVQLAEAGTGVGATPDELLARCRRMLPVAESFTLRAVESHDAFRARVAEAVAAIGRGELKKVVLAREVEVAADRPIEAAQLLHRLRQLHPSCCCFSLDGIVGASPELLVRREGRRVLSQPLAGTVGRSGDPERDRSMADALLASPKERAEHAFVVDAITDALSAFTTTPPAPVEPHLLELRNVVHLATTIEATLRDVPADLGELLEALHPTPAVCGVPRAEALRYLDRTEALRRDRYAGPVGYLDAEGEGEFWLAIRSAILSGPLARLIAGVGIVEGSDPESELAETQLKLQALLAAAVRP
jgi:menaquinone-specific isochorismate synthase